MCELLIGLPEVNVRAVHDEPDESLRVHIESRLDQGWCRACGARAQVKDRPQVEFVDLPCFGRPTRLVWHKPHKQEYRSNSSPPATEGHAAG
jgi:transposase